VSEARIQNVLLTLVCVGALACTEASRPLPPITPPSAEALPAEAALLLGDADQVEIALHPRVEIHEAAAPSPRGASVFLALPARRAALRRVDVHLAVKRSPGGEIAAQKDVTFDRTTKVEALALEVPPLPDGSYEAEIRTVAQVDTVDVDQTLMVDTREVTERAPIVLPSRGHEVGKTFEFHFDPNTTRLVAQEHPGFGRTVAAVGAIFAAHPDATARVDCWASTEGGDELNRALAEKRCEWFDAEVWSKLARRPEIPPTKTAHGPDDVPVAEREDVSAKVLATIRQQNRVVILRLRWKE
jgi:hypothetical protein